MKRTDRIAGVGFSLPLVCLLVIGVGACGEDGSKFIDKDGDGWPPPADCNDGDVRVHPFAQETANDDVDQDCSGRDFVDRDEDGYEPEAQGGRDCDDDDPNAKPGGTEIPYDGIDQDCQHGDLADVDGDGHDATQAGGEDCDDDDDRIHPGATEITGDGIDQNCDGRDVAPVEGDADGDGYASNARAEGLDCDDGDVEVHPGAPERCNDQDDDCDGEIDEGLLDFDGDGSPACKDCDDYNPARSPTKVEAPYNEVDEDCDGKAVWDVDQDTFDGGDSNAPDCDDNNPQVNPAHAEVACNRIDDNCDGATDEPDDISGDDDADGWWNNCDCAPSNAAIHPGAVEQPSTGVDEDCDGLTDEDLDGDGHLSHTHGGHDCNDNNADIYPGALEEPYNAIDEDCDGADLEDVDGDQHKSTAVSGGDDCNDYNAEMHPGHAEVCQDPVDNNCSGAVNESCGPGFDEDVPIPAGPFIRGRQYETGMPGFLLDQSPPRQIELSGYYMDKYEVTISQYWRCVAAGDCDIHSVLGYSAQDERYWFNQARGLHPAIQVTWDDAARYCASVGKRLPSEAEWEKAARGDRIEPPVQLYPWGHVEWELPPGGGAEVRVPIACELANHRELCTQIPCEDDVMPVGDYPDGTSPFGLFNMAGNVREWVADWYRSNYYAISPDQDPPGPRGGAGTPFTTKVVRGGGFDDVDYYLEVTARMHFAPLTRKAGLGFRCARTP